MTSAEKPSLYERLGGVYSIATVVDDLIDRVMVDPRLNANPLVDEAHHRVPPAGFKYLVTEMVCWASGGPQKYTGKPMADSHAHLKITGQEWEAFMDDFQQTLDKFKVPAEPQATIYSFRRILLKRRKLVSCSGISKHLDEKKLCVSPVRFSGADVCASDRSSRRCQPASIAGTCAICIR